MAHSPDDPTGPPPGSDSSIHPESKTTGPLRTPARPPRLPPKDFGDYQFLERLGVGGFGEVFKVWSLSKRRYEAMKVLNHTSASDPAGLEAFKGEIHRIASVPGAHVVHVYHVDALPLPDGRPFFTMEYLNGGRIDQYCNSHRKSIEDRILAVAAICDALHRVHELSLIHCDIKPGNIGILEEADTAVPKLLDFGLASHLALRQPHTGGIVGTLPYMAPEQLESHGNDPQKQWDIYSLGVTLYQLLVGEYPIENFPDKSFPAEFHADHVRKSPIPPLIEKLSSKPKDSTEAIARERRLTADVLRKRLRDPWLDAVVRKALAKDGEERYKTAGEMARNLRCYVARRRPPIVPPTAWDRTTEFVRDHGRALAGIGIPIVVAGLLLWGYAARAAARNERSDRLCYEGMGELEPARAIEKYEQALALTPSRSYIRLHLAAAFLNSGNVRKAQGAAREIPAGDQHYSYAQALSKWAEQLRPPRDDQPEADIAASLSVAPGEEYWYSLTLGRKDADFAIRLLDKALREPSLTKEARFRTRLMLAIRYMQACEYNELATEASGLLEMHPFSAVVWNLHGLGEWKTADLATNEETTTQLVDALHAFDKAIELNSEYASAYINRANVKILLDRDLAALADCRRAAEVDPTLAPYLRSVRISALLGKGDFDAAQAECEAVPAGAVVTAQIHIACGNVWMKRKLPQRAWVEFDLGVTALDATGSCEAQAKYDATYNRAVAALSSARYPDAARDFDAAETLWLNEWNKSWENPAQRGLAYLLSERVDAALADLRAAAQRAKDDPRGAFVYLWIWDLCFASGKLAEADEALQLAAEAAQGDSRITRIVDHAAGKIERDVLLKDAGDDTEKAIEAYYYLGLAAKARGDREEAVACFTQCSRMGEPGPVERDFLAAWQLARLGPKL